jgi:hypothetical protein
VVRGTLLSVEFIVQLLAAVWSHSQILDSYPRLSEVDIRACLATDRVAPGVRSYCEHNMGVERVTVTHRRRAELHRSLDNPHPETVEFAELGLADWAQSLPDDDPESLVNLRAARKIRWPPGEGWS